MKNIKLFFICFTISTNVFSQNNDCGEQINGCSTPAFPITANQGNNAIVDFTPGSNSAPGNPSVAVSSNGNGCMLTGEDNSTFIVITMSSSGTLAFTLGAAGGTGFFDWILWPYTGPATCAGLQAGTVAPLRCNWNQASAGFTGMQATVPAGGIAGNFNPPLTVTAGSQYLLCFNNFSDVNGNVALNFNGTGTISCTGLVADQTICLGSSANVNVLTNGFVNPTYTYLNTTGVANPNAGPANVITPTVTTTYQVNVCEAGNCDLISFTITVVPPPVANAGPDVTTCFGTPFQLQGSATGTAPTHTWSQLPNPGFTPPATSSFAPNVSSWTPNVTANTATTYKYVVTASNPTCPVDKDTVEVTFQKVLLTTTKSDPLCALGATGTITVSSVLGSQFSKDNGVTWQASNIFTGLLAGTYTICAKSTIGCQTCITETLIDPLPVTILVSPTVTICQNGSTTMLATGANGGPFNYNWSHTSDLSSAQVVTPVPLTNTYTVTATNANGCTSLPGTITVNVLPAISGVVSPTQFVCPGYFKTLGALGSGGNGGPYNYLWSDGSVTDSISVTGFSPVTYTVTIDDNCESTPFALSVLLDMYPLPIPLFTATTEELCENEEFEITIDTDTLQTTNYTWKFSNGSVLSNQSKVFLTIPYGEYTVQLIVTSLDGCIDSLTKSQYLISHILPEAEFIWNPSPATMFNTEINLINLSLNNFSNDWSTPLAIPSASSQEAPTIMYPDGISANYNVQLIVTSDFGCKDTVQKEIQILPEVLFYAPNSFTPNGDEHNQTWKFVAEGLDVTSFNLFIVDRWGQIVFETLDINQGWDGTLNGTVVQPGTYNWVAVSKDRLNDKKYRFKGSISVIR